MGVRIARFTVVVREYDEAIAFYTDKLGFVLLEDTDLGAGKRWVRVAPPGSDADILLARATTEHQATRIGDQAGGRVWIFLETDDFWRAYESLVARGVRVSRPPREEAYGTVAVLLDLYGNQFDLIQPRRAD